MKNVLYASFADAPRAEKAVSELLDRGADRNDITVMFQEGYNQGKRRQNQPADQTETGAEWGAGIGLIAGLASVVIPGFGLVVGAGAAALITAGATAGGAVIGGVAGYLTEQGMDREQADQYAGVIQKGGAVLTVATPSGKLQQDGARQVLEQCSGSNIRTVNAPVRR